MKVTIVINCDNAAFEGGAQYETARILKELALHVYSHNLRLLDGTKIRDCNGNTVGKLTVQS